METIDLEVSSSPWKAKKPPWRRRLLAIVEPRRRCPSPSSSSADSWMQMLSPSLPIRGPFLQPKKIILSPSSFLQMQQPKTFSSRRCSIIQKRGATEHYGISGESRWPFVRSFGGRGRVPQHPSLLSPSSLAAAPVFTPTGRTGGGEERGANNSSDRWRRSLPLPPSAIHRPGERNGRSKKRKREGMWNGILQIVKKKVKVEENLFRRRKNCFFLF